MKKEPAAKKRASQPPKSATAARANAGEAAAVRRLRQELSALRAKLQTVIAQLEKQDRDLQNTDDELQQTTANLAGTSMELRKATEEADHRSRVVEQLKDDLTNFLNSVHLPIVILRRDLRVHRFTPAASSVFGLRERDAGRSFSEIRAPLSLNHLRDSFLGVLENLQPVEAVLQDENGRYYQVTVHAYVTSEKRVDGVVISAIDIDRVKKDEQRIREYQDRIQHLAFDAALAEERERRRIAGDLHDHIGQSLALARMKLASARAIGGEAQSAIVEAMELLSQAAGDVRSLMFDLSPPVLYDLGLKEALSWLIDEVKKRHGVEVEMADDGIEASMDETTASLLFRAIRELVLNVVKHAKSPTARVSLARKDGHLSIEVEDHGVGFDPEESLASKRGFGLFNVREQLRRLGGSMNIVSVPRNGTRIGVRIPIVRPPLPPES